MKDLFGGPDSMQMIMEQCRNNPRMEIRSMKAQNEIFCGCFEDYDIKRMKWDGQELYSGDTVYFKDQHGFFWKVKIFVERLDPDSEESRMATIEANIRNHLAFQKQQRKAQSCVDCDVPFAEEGL